MLGYALSLGMTLTDFKRLTPEEFGSVLEVNEKRERARWEQTRTIAVATLRPHLPKGKRGKSETELMPFPWETATKEKKRTPPPSRAEAYARFKQLTTKDGE